MRTWLGPPAGESHVVKLGPVIIEKWPRQPQRTLLFGSSADGKEAKFKEKRSRASGLQSQLIGPGLAAKVAVSKGHPQRSGDSSSLCAGVQLRLADGAPPSCSWYCPCDVKVTLIGDRCNDLVRTIRWVLTPLNDEAFFPMVSLDDVHNHFVSDRGALQMEAELKFLLATPQSVHCNVPFPLGVHGRLCQSLACGFALAGPEVWQSMTRTGSNIPTVGVSRSGAFVPDEPSLSPEGKPSDRGRHRQERPMPLTLLVPGLLPPVSQPPSAYAQEILPGLMIACEAVMTKLVELHDVGVTSLLEVAIATAEARSSIKSPTSTTSEDATPPSRLLCTRKLQLRGQGDVVELVEDSACHAEGHKVLDVVDLVQVELDKAVSCAEGAHYVVVFPREASDVLSCAAVVAAVVAKRCGISLAEAKQYVQSRWDVPLSDMLVSHLWGEKDDDQFLGAQELEDFSGRLLADMAQAFAEGAAEKEVSAKLGDWIAHAAHDGKFRRAALKWGRKHRPWPGLRIEVRDAGWGSISEVFRALAAFGCAEDELSKTPTVTLSLQADLPQGEVLEVPLSVEVGDETCHLLGIVWHVGAASVKRTSDIEEPLLCMLRGQREWMLEDGAVFRVERRSSPTTASSWICTADMSAKAIVYLRGTSPAGSFPANVWQGKKGIKQTVPCPIATEGSIIVRIITERALQQHEGELRGAGDLQPSSIISIPRGQITLAELKSRIQQAVKLPAERQHLLWLPDRFPALGKNWVQSADDLLVNLPKLQAATLLLRFASDPCELDDGLSSQQSDAAKTLLFCRFYDSQSLENLSLGILVADGCDHLVQHQEWVAKRVALAAGEKDVGRRLEALACCMGSDPSSSVQLHMDRPLSEQQVESGCVLLFERAMCGRRCVAPAATQEKFAREAALMHLLQPLAPPCLFGCIILRCNGERSKEVRRARFRSALQRLGSELGLPELHLLPMRGLPTEKASQAEELVFQADLEPGIPQAQLMAEEACHRFTRLHSSAWGAWCGQERSSSYQLRELFLVVCSSGRGTRLTWHAISKQNSHREQTSQPVEELPALLNAALAFDSQTMVMEDAISDTGLSSPTTLELGSVKTIATEEDEPGDTPPIAQGDADAGWCDSLTLEPTPNEEQRQQQTAQVDAQIEDVALQTAGQEQPSFNVAPGTLATQGSSSGKHLRLLTPETVQPEEQMDSPQSQPSPTEVHQPAPTAHLERRVDGPSARADEASIGQADVGASSPSKGIDEAAMIRTVRKMLHSTVDELMALLSHAKTLNLTEDIHHVERRLLSLFSLRGLPQDLRRELPPRSATLSRSSSCESGFEDHVGKEVARFVLNSTPGEVTQPSTPRSVVHTPGSRPRADSRSWLEPTDDGLLVGDLPAAHGDLGYSREFQESYIPKATRFERPGRVMGSHHGGLPGLNFMWHTNPFSISRTPNIRTPVGHCSPARSPTSISGYCSPIPGVPGGGLHSGMASPNQRRSQSGYSSPATDRSHLGPAFFVGTATAHSGLMHRLMSLREAREEMED